jgi:hypothetical protein
MCKPVRTPYKVNKKPQWLPVIRAAVDRSATVKINRDYDVPYLAGYSEDGKTVYIDRHMPKYMVYKGKKYPTDRKLTVHECVEKDLIDGFKLKYMEAHKIATDTEFDRVLASGINLKAYNDFMDEHVKEIGSEKITKAPPDLDLTPYIDEHDEKDLKKLREAMK